MYTAPGLQSEALGLPSGRHTTQRCVHRALDGTPDRHIEIKRQFGGATRKLPAVPNRREWRQPAGGRSVTTATPLLLPPLQMMPQYLRRFSGLPEAMGSARLEWDDPRRGRRSPTSLARWVGPQTP